MIGYLRADSLASLSWSEKWPVAAKGHGKRGGARVIYYHFLPSSQIAMLYIYCKNEQADLSTEQRKALKSIIERWRHA
ncbi:type II toxin-antitoxin system RelE/ParE family toxin [Pseudomonas sp. NY11955]|uniref:type II toxin-antitoxin system RelE/ParE family toxin n=1 Tax=Pseudomonas sp. NY11955 TaxID=3400363 RepID=UPI003A8B6F5D